MDKSHYSGKRGTTPEIQKQVVADILQSPFYSLLLDESTDRTTIKQLAMVVMYVKEEGFLFCMH